MQVERVEDPPTGDAVVAKNVEQDDEGNTSLRFLPREGRELKKDDILDKAYYVRDRDLGQTFTVGETRVVLQAITVRIGPTPTSVKKGARGAAVSVQLFEVSGEATIDDNGTRTAPPKWRTFDVQRATSDDFVTGLSFKAIDHVPGGVIPDDVAPNQYLRFVFSGKPVVLEPQRTYAYLLMFDEPAPDRTLALANRGTGNPYKDGTAIRREGSQPIDLDEEDMFVLDENNPNDVGIALTHASFGPLSQRLATQPGTLGMPDVCTYRDHVFFVEASPAE